MARAEDTIEMSGFAALTGTPKQVGHQLDRLAVEQVIALTLERGSGPAVRALAETFVTIAPLVRNILERRQRETIQSIIEALVPQIPPPQHMLIEARRRLADGCSDRRSGGFQHEQPKCSAQQMEEGGADLCRAALRHRLFSSLCVGSGNRLSPDEDAGQCSETLRREKGRLGPRLLVCVGQQLPWWQTPAGHVGETARARSCGGRR